MNEAAETEEGKESGEAGQAGLMGGEGWRRWLRHTVIPAYEAALTSERRDEEKERRKNH